MGVVIGMGLEKISANRPIYSQEDTLLFMQSALHY